MPKLASVRAASEAAAATLRPSGLPLRSWGAFLMTPDYSLPPGVGLSPRHAAAPSAAVVVGITHGIAGPGATFTGQGTRPGVRIAPAAESVQHICEAASAPSVSISHAKALRHHLLICRNPAPKSIVVRSAAYPAQVQFRTT